MTVYRRIEYLFNITEARYKKLSSTDEWPARGENASAFNVTFGKYCNCGGNHLLPDCKEQHDKEKIAKKRKKTNEARRRTWKRWSRRPRSWSWTWKAHRARRRSIRYERSLSPSWAWRTHSSSGRQAPLSLWYLWLECISFQRLPRSANVESGDVHHVNDDLPRKGSRQW
jgi:hypothetical protein